MEMSKRGFMRIYRFWRNSLRDFKAAQTPSGKIKAVEVCEQAYAAFDAANCKQAIRYSVRFPDGSYENVGGIQVFYNSEKEARQHAKDYAEVLASSTVLSVVPFAPEHYQLSKL
jgi:hypothetical protein